MNVSEGLIPPDFERCQAEYRPAHGAFRLGPPPPRERCTSQPVWLAVEVIAGADGKHGAMTLCQPCAEKLLEVKDLRERTQLQPILATEAAHG